MRKGFSVVMVFVSLVAGMGLISPSITKAAYPEMAVTFIHGFPGGVTEITSRSLAEAAKKYFPKPIVVVCRPGAAGTIGAAEVIQSKPDGYTIGLGPVAVLTVQPHRTKLPYGSPDDYTPIMKLVNIPLCLSVKSTAPWKTIQEFIAYAKANPGKLRVGHPGIGTIPHLDIELLKMTAKIDFISVPFAGGGESVPALVGGHIDAVSQHPGDVLPQVQAGNVRVIGVFEEKRNPLFPDVQTFREAGYDITLAVYYTVIGPKGLPPHIVSTLHDAFKKSMGDPAFIKPIEAGGLIISYEGPEATKKRLMGDYERNKKFIDILRPKAK